MGSEIDIAAQALHDLREVHDLLERGQLEHRVGWFLCIALASAFKDTLHKEFEQDTSPLGIIVNEVMDRHWKDEIAEVITMLTSNSLVYTYRICYDAGFDAKDADLGDAVVMDMLPATPSVKKGQLLAGSLQGKPTVDIVRLAIAWCEQVMFEIEQKAAHR